MIIVPTILTDDPEEAKSLVKRIEDCGKLPRVQIDFVDGMYANNLTICPAECHLERFPSLKFDAHLMVVEKNIDWYCSEVKRVGFDRTVVQMESVSSPEKYDCLAMDTHSPVAAVEPYLPGLKYVVVVSVEPGFGGQKFEERAMKLIKRLSEVRIKNKYKYLICVDGGVQREHLGMLKKAGADEVAVGAGRVLSW
jgi:ribulose-phosphate 3-epimerase